MARTNEFQRYVISVLEKYRFTIKEFADFSGIHGRTLEHWVAGDVQKPPPRNKTKLDIAVNLLEESDRHEPNHLVNLTGSSSPITVRWGNVLITLEYLREA